MAVTTPTTNQPRSAQANRRQRTDWDQGGDLTPTPFKRLGPGPLHARRPANPTRLRRLSHRRPPCIVHTLSVPAAPGLPASRGFYFAAHILSLVAHTNETGIFHLTSTRRRRTPRDSSVGVSALQSRYLGLIHPLVDARFLVRVMRFLHLRHLKHGMVSACSSAIYHESPRHAPRQVTHPIRRGFSARL